jgi:phosphoribosylformylglycinamidine (FGAM) synthase-like enzyme
MKFNTLLIILVVVMVGMTAVNMFMAFNNRLDIDTLSSISYYTYDYEGRATLDIETEILFKKPNQMTQFLEQYDKPKQEQLADFQESITKFAESFKRLMTVEDFQSTATVLSNNRVKVVEYAVIAGFSAVEDGVVNTDMGDMEFNLVGVQSSLTLRVPSDANVLSVEPQPSNTVGGSVFIWTDTGKTPFPKIRFSR